MPKNLVVVESPAKAKTLKKYLGKDFHILASYGHVRDLLPKKGAVDPDHQFAMTYQIIEKNVKHIAAIAKALPQAEALYLATDPDREGEAIAWHIYELLKRKKAMKGKPVHRITFHEITEQAVQQAVGQPKSLSMDLIHAQQARRALDYLVGFTLSPLLWKKVQRGLSAGRVQSPALRLIVERELEIETFKSQEYWTITATVQAENTPSFQAKLITYQNQKLSQFSIQTEAEATQIKTALLAAAQGKLQVEKIEKKTRKRQPAAPFITATLQQEAAHQLNFTAQRTMRVAQQLYEGIEIDEGPVGLITYMRTDSVTLAHEAIQAVRNWIQIHYGVRALPKDPRQFQTKSKNAQEAHEAIRPTSPEKLPESIKSRLSTDQFKLYELIWKRTIASQMLPATLELLAIELQDSQKNVYRASGSTIIQPGFMQVYHEALENPSQSTEISHTAPYSIRLPALQAGNIVNLLALLTEQHFTEPPPRYNEASLIKTLENHDIGRPSTYVPIISTLQQRKYVTLEQKRFKPTDVGRVVNKFLTQYFSQYVDYDFTAQLEGKLDAIARGETIWIPVLEDFWLPFKERIQTTEETVQRQAVTQEPLDENCPQCSKQLSNRLGKRGRFIGCSAYPECDYTRDLHEAAESPQAPSTLPERNCPSCGQALQIKFGRYGKFIGCSQYPKCKHIEPLEKPENTGVECPECQQGHLLKRKSRYSKVFYACSAYPTCQYAIWHEPRQAPCPQCAWPITTIKTTKRRGTEQVCPRKTCAYAEMINETEGA
jgi:DNA topoisomerase I